MNTLTTILSLAQSRLPLALLPPKVGARLEQLSLHMPSIPWLGFECRLGENESQVDLQQGFDLGEGHLENLLAFLETKRTAEERLPDHWQRIFDFCQAWKTSTTLHNAVSAIGLEFDVTNDAGQSQVPSLFLSFDKMDISTNEALTATKSALQYLLEKPLSEMALNHLIRCFELCPPLADVGFVGIMLSRSLEAVRINIRRLPQNQMIDYLQAVGWSGNLAEVEALVERLFEFVEKMTLCLDVGTAVYPSLGLECFFDKQPPQEPGWRNLLQHFVDGGLCTPQKRDALLQWPGKITPLNSAAPWPEALIVKSLHQAPDQFDLFNCWINHIKISYRPNYPIKAKAYLGFRQQPFISGALKTTPSTKRAVQKLDLLEMTAKIHNNISREQISAAMNAAGAFLLASRSQQGWWKDFQLPAGPSDEWVTAYVGTMLALMPQEHWQQAAHQAWRLLNTRRQQTDGWGYNAHTPTDADSTAWALQLAQAVRSNQTSRVREASHFLAQHIHPGGGVTTYAEKEPIRDYYEALAQSVPFTGWHDVHTCVTAAVAHIQKFSENVQPFLQSKQNKLGYWPGYWWCDPEYATALTVEAFDMTNLQSVRPQVDRAIQWASNRIGPNGGVHSTVHGSASAFATAWCIRILAQASDVAAIEAKLVQAVTWLLMNQLPNGTWPSSSWMRVPPPNAVKLEPHPPGTIVVCDQNAIFTTATALAALNVAQSCFLKIDMKEMTGHAI